MVPDQAEQLEAALGYRFHDRELLQHALTHSSRRSEIQYSNERMEFLGDALLGAVVSEHVYRECPDFTEGELTRVKSRVVSRDTLATIAEGLDLGRYLLVAKGVAQRPSRNATPEAGDEAARDTSPRERLPVSLVSNAFEAIIAAVYLDSDIHGVRDFILRHMRAEIEGACNSAHVQNYKSALQQRVQRKMGQTPSYRVVAEQGPDHVKSFEVVTVIGTQTYGSGRGKTKKEAEQLAARETLAMLQAEDKPRE